MDKKTVKSELRKKEIELVIARLETLSPKVYFSSGDNSNGSNISRDEMIQHVRNDDAIGKDFMETDLEFLRALKDGKLLNQIIASPFATNI